MTVLGSAYDRAPQTPEWESEATHRVRCRDFWGTGGAPVPGVCRPRIAVCARVHRGGDRSARNESGAPPYGARAGRHRRDTHVHTRGRRATTLDTTRARHTDRAFLILRRPYDKTVTLKLSQSNSPGRRDPHSATCTRHAPQRQTRPPRRALSAPASCYRTRRPENPRLSRRPTRLARPWGDARHTRSASYSLCMPLCIHPSKNIHSCNPFLHDPQMAKCATRARVV